MRQYMGGHQEGGKGGRPTCSRRRCFEVLMKVVKTPAQGVTGRRMQSNVCELSVTQPTLPPWGLVPWLLSLQLIPTVLRSNPCPTLYTSSHERSFRSKAPAMQRLLKNNTVLLCLLMDAAGRGEARRRIEILLRK